MRTMASCALMIVGSGTSVTRTFFGPYQQVAFIACLLRGNRALTARRQWRVTDGSGSGDDEPEDDEPEGCELHEPDVEEPVIEADVEERDSCERDGRLA